MNNSLRRHVYLVHTKSIGAATKFISLSVLIKYFIPCKRLLQQKSGVLCNKMSMVYIFTLQIKI
jgi:hypothetical protein